MVGKFARKFDVHNQFRVSILDTITIMYPLANDDTKGQLTV